MCLGHLPAPKLLVATYQHVLLHRIVALMDGTAIAWNNHCTLSAILSARALMETVAVIAEFDERVSSALANVIFGAIFLVSSK
jgi:hypothetical protein